MIDKFVKDIKFLNFKMDTEIIAGRCCCRIKYVWKTWSKKGQW